MSTTLYDVLKYYQNPFSTAFLRQIAMSDELWGMIPIGTTDAEALSYEREVSLGSFNFIAPGGTVAKSNSKSERIAVTKREATEDFEVDNYALDNMAGSVNPAAREAAQKAKVAGQTIAGKILTGRAINTITVEDWDTFVTAIVAASAFITERRDPGELQWDEPGNTLAFRAPGDRTFGAPVTISGSGDVTLYSDSPSKWITVTLNNANAPTADGIRRIAFGTTTNEFEGLPNMMSPNRSVDKSAATLTFTMLDEALDAVKNKDGQVVFAMRSEMRRKLQSLLRGSGGTEPQFVMGNGLRVPTFMGYPVLMNDNIPIIAGDDSSIYCMNLTEPLGSGVWLTAFNGGAQINEMADPRDQPVVGFRLRDVGQSHTNSRHIWRMTWYGTPGLGSDLSIYRLYNVSAS